MKGSPVTTCEQFTLDKTDGESLLGGWGVLQGKGVLNSICDVVQDTEVTKTTGKKKCKKKETFRNITGNKAIEEKCINHSII